MENVVTQRKHIGCSPAEVQVGDILCRTVTTSVDPRGSGHGSATVDVGMVVRPPYEHVVQVHRMSGLTPIDETRIAFDVENPWGEVESVRGMHSWDLVTVRRKQ